jgi:1,4-dihydroxy-2-naphthoate octaprenyltransferase
MTGSPGPPRAGSYWPVLLLDISAVAILLILALTLPASPWWWILAVLWAAVACRRALNQYRTSHARDHP